jgi:uncharacterized membrane protein YfbV (UPF0208 family)
MIRFRVAYGTNLGRAVVNTVMNMPLPLKAGISWLAKVLLASQEELRYVEWVGYLVKQ